MRQKLGQHFLTNTEALEKVAAAIPLNAEKIVIEIGPGHGELTDEIIKLSPSKLILIEKDSDLVTALREKYSNKKFIEIIEGDILKVLPSLTAGLRPRSYDLFGNLPYYLTGFLFRVIEELSHKPGFSVFSIQKEVAERLVAKPPRMNRLAAAVQWWSDPEIVGLISRDDFDPPPEVDSATIVLKTKASNPSPLESKKYYAALHAVFAQPRKTIVNNLVSSGSGTRAQIENYLKELSIPLNARSQDLSVEEICIIGKELLK
jgi:16S rRNA (adenine1518-N6/adenine1519-N6)-dimethyltransferase